ncbi:MAG: carboxylating nicotinate-nucleotide diphosphorylase [Candidatus Endonucleobacter sp. (ex Gigantidas childressi)]|nr:carboxylating nicotinate-nucleotide diphosphorylase [Candidatus Endonucleobacter sp. (ex Gigantidas childressi)]
MISQLKDTIYSNVYHSLQEDMVADDITAALIPPERQAIARVICRENATICGRLWFDEVFHQLDPSIQLNWQVKEGERVLPNQEIVQLKGCARNLLTGERCALNFLQTLSGTASISAYYTNLVKDLPVKLLDTRKTLPGLRLAQKYAVKIGGCFNHRLGLHDAFLIKENHIAACGGIKESVATARAIAPNKPIEMEVESIEEFREAKAAGVDTVMLDNFSLTTLRETVLLNKSLGGKSLWLEASGGITEKNLLTIAATGVDYISIGALTKNCKAVDLSMGFIKAK